MDRTGRAVGAVERAVSTLWDKRASRGRVAEWPVTDPILPVLVLTQRAVAQILNLVEMAAY